MKWTVILITVYCRKSTSLIQYNEKTEPHYDCTEIIYLRLKILCLVEKAIGKQDYNTEER